MTINLLNFLWRGGKYAVLGHSSHIEFMAFWHLSSYFIDHEKKV
jgi:hypothetical protein